MKYFRETYSDRRAAQPLSYCRRRELAPGFRLGSRPSVSLLRALRRFDRDLELYWHPARNRWILYRVKRHETPGSDEMVREMILQGPGGEYRDPGMWMIEELKRRDIFKGGAVDPDIARREWIEGLLEKQPATRAAEKRIAHMNHEMALDLYKYAWMNKRHFAQGTRQ